MAIKNYVKDDATWETYYSGVRKTIHRVTRGLLSKRSRYPTLYSTRHQFAANAKSEGMSKVELAAVMGHAVDGTAGLHYGKKKHGCGSCRIIADRSEVMKVRVNIKPKQFKSHRM